MSSKMPNKLQISRGTSLWATWATTDKQLGITFTVFIARVNSFDFLIIAKF
jgi:hypothetical protein